MLPGVIARWVVAAVAIVAGACAGGDSDGRGTLRVSGSTTVSPIAVDAAEVLRRRGLEISVDSQGGSAGGIAQLAAGQVDVAMSSKPLSDQDRARHRAVRLVATEIGADAVGIVVRKEVYEGGVRNLTREQLRAVFEGRVANWKELGGPDIEVFVYDKEPGRGTREVLDRYLYPDGRVPPPPASRKYAVVGGNVETRSKLASTPGSVGPLSVSFIEGVERLRVVAVEGAEPIAARVADRSYGMHRSLLLITDGPPAGAARNFVEYVLSPGGQDLVRKHGYLAVSDLRT